MSKVFESFKRPATKNEIAAQVTHDTIDELEALRKGREDQPHTDQEKSLMERLAVLMCGPRKAGVLPVILKRMPQMAMLLEREVGIVTACHFGDHNIAYGIIKGINDRDYKFTEQDAKEAGLEMDSTAQVSFLATDDGMARNIQVIELQHG